jgi:hypothetical protein
LRDCGVFRSGEFQRTSISAAHHTRHFSRAFHQKGGKLLAGSFVAVVMSPRKELIAFFLVAAVALGSILSFALTSHRREAQTRPGTLVQAAAVNGVCPAQLKVRRGAGAAVESPDSWARSSRPR